MKLWWVHLEAMVATLMVFNNTRKEEDWDRFRKVFKYSFEKRRIRFGKLLQ